MKKILITIISLTMLLGLTSCGNKKEDYSNIKIGMVVAFGDITDQTYNQTIYQTCKDYTTTNEIEFQYYKTNGDHLSDIVDGINKAIKEGCNILVIPGYPYVEAVAKTAPNNSNVKFIVYDMTKDDIKKYIYDDSDPKNIYTINFKEEISGFMAGYAAVKLGYKKLGFLGGVPVPSVIRYGYGFIQGADTASKDLGTSDIEIKYAYGNQFFGDNTITKKMKEWYEDGTQVIFAAGGGIFTSAAEAAKKAGGKIIGVDVDQALTVNPTYGDDITLTSAMKSLEVATKEALVTNIENVFTSNVDKNDVKLGVVSDDPERNYVGLPLKTTLFNNGFSLEDYNELTSKIYQNVFNISDDITKEPEDFATVVTLKNYGLLK